MPTLLIDWLDPGEVPVFDRGSSTVWVVPYEGDPAWVLSYGRRAIVPLREVRIDDLSRFLSDRLRGAEEESLVIVTLRTVYPELGFVLLGVAYITPCPAEVVSGGTRNTMTMPLTTAARGASDDLVVQAMDAITGPRGGRDTSDMHPVLRAMNERIVAKHEHHQRVLEMEPDSEISRALEDANDFVRHVHARFENTRRTEARARSLLLELLTPKQVSTLQRNRYFDVEGADGSTYRIHDEFSHNVCLLKDGEESVEFCILTETKTPRSDHLLAQKLLLEADIERFHKIANFRPVTDSGLRRYRRRAHGEHT